jgi:hypothetical protein
MILLVINQKEERKAIMRFLSLDYGSVVGTGIAPSFLFVFRISPVTKHVPQHTKQQSISGDRMAKHPKKYNG